MRDDVIADVNTGYDHTFHHNDIKEKTNHEDKQPLTSKEGTEYFLYKIIKKFRDKQEENRAITNLEISFEPRKIGDLNLIKYLYDYQLIDENYLKELCQINGIQVIIYPSEVWYPTFHFSKVISNKQNLNEIKIMVKK